MTQEDEIRQIEIENEIVTLLDKLYVVLMKSDRIEAEEQLGHIAQFKEFWETGTPMDEQNG